MLSYIRKQPALAILALLAVFAMFGCEKNKESLQHISKERPRPRSAGDGKNDLLGYGYDVTGEYANSSASKFSVIDMDALQKDQPTRVEWDLSKKQVGNLVSGENATSYLKKLGLKLDGTFGIGVFKGSVKASYSSSDAFSAKFVYSSFNLLIQQRRGKIGGGLTLLKKHLQPSFLYDVQYESPEYIVSSYGTHVLTDITLGAKLQVMYRSQTSNSEREKASEIGVDVSVNKVFSVSVGLNYTYSQKEVDANFSQSLHYKTIGGNPSKSLIGEVPVGNEVPKVNIKDWQESSTVANAELIDFNTEGMVPIYDLIDDPVKKEAVKSYLRLYLKDNEAFLERIYAKVSRENPVFKKDQWGEGTYYDYYIRFYKEDKTTPVNAGDLTVRYLFGFKDVKTGVVSYQYPENTIRVVDANSIFMGNHPGTSKSYANNQPEYTHWMEIFPGSGYEVLP